MASNMSNEQNCCLSDPNYAVICSYLNQFGGLLGLPIISFSDIESFVQETDAVPESLVALIIRLLRRTLHNGFRKEQWMKSLVKFCRSHSDVDAWEVEKFNYCGAALTTKLRVLKYLLEAQFDCHSKFKDKINEKSPDELRILPCGRDLDGLNYWYLIDNDMNIRLYQEEQDDPNEQSWNLVSSSRGELVDLIGKLSVRSEKADDSRSATPSITSSSACSKNTELKIAKLADENSLDCDSLKSVSLKMYNKLPDSPLSIRSINDFDAKKENCTSDADVVKTEAGTEAGANIKTEPDAEEAGKSNVDETGVKQEPLDRKDGVDTAHVDQTGNQPENNYERDKNDVDGDSEKNLAEEDAAEDEKAKDAATVDEDASSCKVIDDKGDERSDVADAVNVVDASEKEGENDEEQNVEEEKDETHTESDTRQLSATASTSDVVEKDDSSEIDIEKLSNHEELGADKLSTSVSEEKINTRKRRKTGDEIAEKSEKSDKQEPPGKKSSGVDSDAENSDGGKVRRKRKESVRENESAGGDNDVTDSKRLKSDCEDSGSDRDKSDDRKKKKATRHAEDKPETAENRDEDYSKLSDTENTGQTAQGNTGNADVDSESEKSTRKRKGQTSDSGDEKREKVDEEGTTDKVADVAAGSDELEKTPGDEEQDNSAKSSGNVETVAAEDEPPVAKTGRVLRPRVKKPPPSSPSADELSPRRSTRPPKRRKLSDDETENIPPPCKQNRGPKIHDSRRKRKKPAKEIIPSSSSSEDDVPLSSIRGRGRKNGRNKNRAKGRNGEDDADFVPGKTHHRSTKKRYSESETDRDDLSEEDYDEEDDDDEKHVWEEHQTQFDPFLLESELDNSTADEADDDSELEVKGRNARRVAARVSLHVSQDDDNPCSKCSKNDHPEMIILCDTCDAGFHTSCLRPPLMVIPEGDWFCPTCEHRNLISRLQEYIKHFDVHYKEKERMDRRKERLAYVTISLDNVLHTDRDEVEVAREKKQKKRKDRDDRQRHRKQYYDWDEEEAEGEDDDDDDDDDEEDDEEDYAYPRSTRERKQINYRFEEFDEMINDAIKDEVREIEGVPHGRGKDISNITGVKDSGDEKNDGVAKVKADEEEEGEDAETKDTPKKETYEDDDDVKRDDDDDDGDDEEADREKDRPSPVLKRSARKRKGSRLTNLDPEDVDDGGEDYKASEDEEELSEEDEANSLDEESELSDCVSRGSSWRRQLNRRSGGTRSAKKSKHSSRSRRRTGRSMKAFVADDDSDEFSEEIVRRSMRATTSKRVNYADVGGSADSDDSYSKSGRKRNKARSDVSFGSEEETAVSEFSDSDASAGNNKKKVAPPKKRKRFDAADSESSVSSQQKTNRASARGRARKNAEGSSSDSSSDDDNENNKDDDKSKKRPGRIVSSSEGTDDDDPDDPDKPKKKEVVKKPVNEEESLKDDNTSPSPTLASESDKLDNNDSNSLPPKSNGKTDTENEETEKYNPPVVSIPVGGGATRTDLTTAPQSLSNSSSYTISNILQDSHKTIDGIVNPVNPVHLQAVPPVGEEDELTGVTDLISYVTGSSGDLLSL